MSDQLHSLLDEAGHAANMMAGDVAKLTVLLDRVIGATRDTVKKCGIEELDTLLKNLAEADVFYWGHHTEARDWSECCRRKDAAVGGLIRYARLYVANGK